MYGAEEMKETEFGKVLITENLVSIMAGHSDLVNWATRPGSKWPCSTLADLEDIFVSFDKGGLLVMGAVQELPNDETEDVFEEINMDEFSPEVMGDELSAWASDVLRDVLPTDHPCWFITVGQFDSLLTGI